MQYCLAVFKSRNETLYLAKMIMTNGYHAGIINTPREIGVACGISVQFSENIVAIVRGYIKSKPFRSFVGVFRVEKINGRFFVERI